MALRLRDTARLGLFAALGFSAALVAQELQPTGTKLGWRQHDNTRPKAPVVEPPPFNALPRPADAVVLFDGHGLGAWKASEGAGPAAWKLRDDYFEVAPGAGGIQTKEAFGDIQLHVEWASPNPPVGKGQDRGNSGIFLMGQFEVQVLDSYKTDTYTDGQAGALYGQYPPLFNASRAPGEWQTYDIAFRRPRFDKAGKLVTPARVSVIHNGILIQNNEELLGGTNWLRWVPYENQGDAGPISLQDHGHTVRFRNVWLRKLPERVEPTPEALARPARIAMTDEQLDRFVGDYSQGRPNEVPFRISRIPGGLQVKFPFRPHPVTMEPIADDVFDMPFTDGRWTFRLDDSGKVKDVIFKIGDAERTILRVK